MYVFVLRGCKKFGGYLLTAVLYLVSLSKRWLLVLGGSDLRGKYNALHATEKTFGKFQYEYLPSSRKLEKLRKSSGFVSSVLYSATFAASEVDGPFSRCPADTQHTHTSSSISKLNLPCLKPAAAVALV